MAFESVDTSRLREAINSCRDAINYEKTNEAISSITDSNVWNTKSRSFLKNQLDYLVDTRYQDLKNKLSAYEEIPGYIDRYNELYDQIQSYRARIHELENEIAEAPDVSYYSVESGDSLYGIASMYGTTVDEIMEVNDIENASLIYVGQSITIPGGVDTSGMESEIAELNSLIEENIDEMNGIEQTVYSIV